MHQHIFKVGWLLTQNYETTTILYYTFFLPGIILHEVIYWLVAGLLDVRAERSIKWPEKQEIGELRLNFVQLARRTGRIQRAIISSAPLIIGLVIVWLMATNIFDIAGFMTTISSGDLNDVGAGFSQLLSTPDFWLWFYILFTISNTMFPHLPKDLQGWRAIIASLAVAAAILLILGIGNSLFSALSMPITTSMSVIEGTLVLIIGVNVIMVLALGTIEYVVERATGRSATFRRGKMITMTRAEAVEQRQRERERQRTALERRKAKALEDAVIPSVYHLTLPVPGGPGEEPIIRAQPRLLDVEDAEEKKDVDALESGTTSPRLGVGTISRQSERPQGSTRPSTLSLGSGVPTSQDEEGDDDEEPIAVTGSVEKPVTTNPFAKSGSDDIEDGDMDEDSDTEDDDNVTSSAPVNPFATRPAAVAKPTVPSFSRATTSNDDEEDDEDTDAEKSNAPVNPFAARPSIGAKPTVPSFSGGSDDDDMDDDELVYEDIDDDYAEDDVVPDEPF
ncbi:MAG: hypothetical protein H6670_09605 [Anaerolineaceae bacterium]|nr:hypothetical protein [Anaerolineaceae bacterium]